MKISSYIKALIPEVKQYPSHFRGFTSISPRNQYDIASQVIPKVGANSWDQNIDIKYLQKMYDCHDLVHGCIELISSTFAQGTLKVKKLDPITKKYNFAPNHPLQILLDNPNSSMTGYDLRQSYTVHRYLNGTVAFILVRGDRMVLDGEANSCPECKKTDSNDCSHVLWHFNTGPITQILPCHPDRIGTRVYNTSRGKKEYFTYNWDNNVTMVIHPNNIMTDPFYNPGGSFLGSSPTDHVKRWLEIDLGLSRQIGAYLLNNAIPSMILNIKPQEGTSDEDPSTLLESIKEKWIRDFSMSANGRNNGGGKAKTPAFVYGDMEIHRIQDALKDIVVKPLFYEIQNRICMAYGVPPSFFEFGQDYGSQSTTIQQQEKNFFNRTISKNLYSFKAKIERMVLCSFPDAQFLKLEWDLSTMPIASFLTDQKESRMLKRWELGTITLDELREEVGLNPFHDDEQGSSRYRTSVMSDGSIIVGNAKPEDNRLTTDPETDFGNF